MLAVLGMWEKDWMEAERTERRLWKQTIQAFGVDSWAMCGVQGGPFTSPVQYEDIDAMLGAYPGPKTFLIAPGRIETVSLADYEHPGDGVYVFGNCAESLASHVTDDDDAVSIITPNDNVLFGCAALAAVLYDRAVKGP